MEQAKVPLHQDGPYFPHISNFATVWIPLCAITEECGGINVLEGSHRRGPVRHEEAVLWGNTIPHEDAAGYTDRHILMEPGDALIFGPHLQHYTHANTSGQVRTSIDSRWFGDATATTRQYFDLRSRQVVQMF
jgi:ectoine hydroxylase-related dioxygenase (phytanoyl-CoA dioxygenase family)